MILGGITMKMKPLNIKTTKKCAFCKYWYDPANTAIRPRNAERGLWEFDPDVKKICEKKRYERPSDSFCGKYECKI
jgi:hypothetical protein